MGSDVKRYVIGFTGPRAGMTPAQRARVRELLAEAKRVADLAADLERSQGRAPGPQVVALHGDCVGADADFDALCAELGIDRTCRPCTFESMRARTGAREIGEPKAPMERNREIVADAHEMIACPPNDMPIKRGSGTWATIGFTRRAKKTLTIVYPDGRAETEGR